MTNAPQSDIPPGWESAVVYPIEGCRYAITVEGTEGWSEQIGVVVTDAFCPWHPDEPLVRDIVRTADVWR